MSSNDAQCEVLGATLATVEAQIDGTESLIASYEDAIKNARDMEQAIKDAGGDPAAYSKLVAGAQNTLNGLNASLKNLEGQRRTLVQQIADAGC
jgi:chromosome segregation ATPase